MSPIPSMASKFTSKLFKIKKDTIPEAATSPSTPSTRVEAKTFDAASPLSKNFRKLSINIDSQQRCKPARPSEQARIGLPSIDEVAVTRRHSAPQAVLDTPRFLELDPAQFARLSTVDQEAYVALEISRELPPAKPYVVLGVVPPPADFNVKVPTTPGTPGKSILKKSKTFNDFMSTLPRLDEKTPLQTPRRQSTMSSVESNDGLNGGPLSRTVSFDHHTDAQLAQRAMLKEEREVVNAFRRNVARQEKLKANLEIRW